MRKVLENIALIGSCFCVFCSCGTLKKNINKTSQNENIDTEVCTTVTRTVTEVADTLVTIPGSNIQRSQDIDSLLQGEPLKVENQQIEVEVKYDPIKKRISVTGFSKPGQIPVSINRKIVEQVKQQSKIKDEVKTYTVTKQKERTAVSWKLWLLFILIVAGMICYIIKRNWPV